MRRWCPLDADTLFTLFMERVEPWVTSWKSQSAAQLIDATKKYEHGFGSKSLG